MKERHRIFGGAIAAMLIATLPVVTAQPAPAQTLDDLKSTCGSQSNGTKHPHIIEACEAIIAKGNVPIETLAWAYGNRCSLRRDQGDALSDCETALRLHRDQSTQVAMASYLMTHKGLAEAGDILKAVLDANPGSAEANSRMGSWQGVSKDYGAAIESFKRAIAIDPRFSPAYNGLARAYHLVGDDDAAMATLNTLRGFDVLSLSDLALAASILQKRGKLDEALAQLNAAVADDRLALYQRALLLMKMWRNPDALADLLAYEKLKPDNMYPAILADYLRTISGVNSPLWSEAGRFDLSKWPGPIVAYLIGQMGDETVFAQARADSEDAVGHVCEANTYIGLHLVAVNDRDASRPDGLRGYRMLNAALRGCPRDYIEYEYLTLLNSGHWPE